MSQSHEGFRGSIAELLGYYLHPGAMPRTIKSLLTAGIATDLAHTGFSSEGYFLSDTLKTNHY